MTAHPPLVLASGSRARREMLAAAGLQFEVAPAADVDEPTIRDRLRATDPNIEPGAIALALAEAKALEVSLRRPRALVVGADQVLVQGQRLFEKPGSLAEARQHLMDLRGRRHELVSAAALAADGRIVWSAIDRAELTMRAFSDAFLQSYLERAGGRVTESVGAYQLEGLGLQLFERIAGDYFTILGMPLLAVLAALRERGVVAS